MVSAISPRFSLARAGLAVLIVAAGAAQAGPSSPGDPQTDRLRMTNQCGYTIWVQQDFSHPVPGVDVVVEIADGASYDYPIPDAGLAATRFWAKSGCNQYGYNCGVGESVGVPAAQAAGEQTTETIFDAPIDSKFEGTFGCTLSDPSQCAENPAAPGTLLGSATSWDASAVDGYTFPYQINVKNDPDGTCTTPTQSDPVSQISCGALDPTNYCANNDLSSGGTWSTINGVDVTDVAMQYTAYTDDSQVVGCFSPCAKLTALQWNGWKAKLGLSGPKADQAQMYCCPTDPSDPPAAWSVSATQCRTAGKEIAGMQVPAAGATSAYVSDVHEVCDSYAYAYDDEIGLVTCAGTVQYEMVFCPSGAASAPPQVPQRPATQTFCNSTIGQMCPGDIPCPTSVAACGANPEMCRCPVID